MPAAFCEAISDVYSVIIAICYFYFVAIAVSDFNFMVITVSDLDSVIIARLTMIIENWLLMAA